MPRYCSAACRQKACRVRQKQPVPPCLRQSGLQAIADRTARVNGALRVPCDFGYDAHLACRNGPPPKRRRPGLTVVGGRDAPPRDEELTEPSELPNAKPPPGECQAGVGLDV